MFYDHTLGLNIGLGLYLAMSLDVHDWPCTCQCIPSICKATKHVSKYRFVQRDSVNGDTSNVFNVEAVCKTLFLL